VDKTWCNTFLRYGKPDLWKPQFFFITIGLTFSHVGIIVGIHPSMGALCEKKKYCNNIVVEKGAIHFA
jgi:hypothetical protein